LQLADSSSQTLLFFIDEEGGGIYQQEMITHSHSCHLIGLDVPYIVFSDQDGKVSNQVLSDFVGLEDESPLALAAILDFSFYSRLGEIDKSFESLQAIKSPRVWSHIVPICIKMKRLDLTEICLSHTTSPEGLAAVELAKKEPEVEVALAAAAVQFGFYNMAKDLYIECQRYDLVNQLLQMLGEWDAAIQVAEVDDVIHSDLTRYQYARYLEENERQFDKAAVGKYAKKSVKFQALVRERRLDELECFVSQHNDKELYSWFGQFNQSLGNIDKAFEYFSLAGDDVKLVELHCSEGNFNEAHRIVDEGGNAAAAYYLSKFFSGSDAIKLLSAGGMFNHAIRLAITENLDSELLDLASKSISPKQASSCAQYFEKKGLAVDACRLFARSGETAKALAICLTLLDHNEEDDKETIDLFVSLVKKSSGEIPSELSQQVYHWLQQAGEADLIVDVICSKTKDPHECLHFFSNHDIQLSEAIVTKLLSLCADEESNDILQGIAMACSEQGSFKLACDLYTRCGEETKAIKCLFNAGDAEALSALANESKSTSVYALAANYLQKM
jgi:intraflagellar transport protein 140